MGVEEAGARARDVLMRSFLRSPPLPPPPPPQLGVLKVCCGIYIPKLEGERERGRCIKPRRQETIRRILFSTPSPSRPTDFKMFAVSTIGLILTAENRRARDFKPSLATWRFIETDTGRRRTLYFSRVRYKPRAPPSHPVPSRPVPREIGGFII